MSGTNVSAELQSWIQVVYAGGPNASQGNQWLMEFSITPAAWEASLSLLNTNVSPEVRFFCANMLLTKVKSEWGKLSLDQRSQLPGIVSQKLQQLLTEPQHLLPCMRLCIVLGTTAAYTGGEAAGGFLAQALQMAAASPQSGQAVLQCAVQMLTSYAEEAEELDRGRRQSAIEAAKPHRLAVLSMVESILTQQLAPAGTTSLLIPAMGCLQCWLKLDPSGGGSNSISPGQLRSSHPALFNALLSLLTADAAGVAETASEVTGSLLGPWAIAEDPALDTAALEAAVTALLSQRDQALQAGPTAQTTAAAIARVAASIASRDAPLLGRHQQLALPLADLMLTCTAARDRKVAESSLDYFVALNTVPVSERLQPLQSEIFARVVQAVFHHLCYPSEFTSWDDEVEDNEDAFHDFREQVAADFLDTVVGILGVTFVVDVVKILEGATNWQAVEGALFCLVASASSIKDRLMPRPHSGQPPGQDHATAAAAFHRLFTLLSTQTPTSQHLTCPYACETAARLVGVYASLLASPPPGTPTAPLDGVLRLLLAGMRHPQSQHHSAQSFRVVCSRCREMLAPQQLLYPLMDAAMAVIAPLPADGQVAAAVAMDSEDRGAVVEGLSGVVAVAEQGAVVEAGLKLLHPFIVRASSITHAGGEVGPQELNQLAGEVRLVASSIRHMDFPPSSVRGDLGHPAVRLLEGAWPLLSALGHSPLCRHTPEVVEALCEAYQRFLLSARVAAKPVLRLLMTSLLEIFSASPHPPILKTLGIVAEQFGQVVSDSEVMQLQNAALATATSTTMQAVQGSSGRMAQQGELVGALLSLGQRYLLFSKDLLAASPTVPSLFQTAVSALQLRDKEPVAPAIALLNAFLLAATKAGDDAESAALAARVNECMAQWGKELVTSLVVGLTDTTPRQLWRQLSGLLYTLVSSPTYQQAASSLLQSGLTSPDLPVLKANAIKEESCQRFCALMLKQPRLTRGRFDALVSDFAGLARGEASEDALLAYEI